MSFAVEFGRKDDADAVRDEFEEFVCPLDDDRRTKTVHFVDGTPESVVEQIDAVADESTSRREDSIGQLELTDAERDRIDFSKPRANVPWAQSIKALAARHGVSDWTAHVDPTLTVDEHRDVMRRAGQQGGGARDSGDQRDMERQRQAARAQQDQQCDHAEGECRNGDPEACEFLQTACGFAEAEVNQMLAVTDGGVAVGDSDDLVTVGDPPTEMRVTPETAGALSRSWQGFKGAVSEFEQTLSELREAWTNAQQAAISINSIRDNHARVPLHFDSLEAAQAELLDLLRDMADDCHECHADHSGHDHPVTAGDRESITEAIREGVASTPVGVDDDADLPPSTQLAEREPDRDRDRTDETMLRELAEDDDDRPAPVRREQADADRDLRSLADADAPETVGPLDLRRQTDDEIHYRDGDRGLWIEPVGLSRYRVSLDASSTSFQQETGSVSDAVETAELAGSVLPETPEGQTFAPETQGTLDVGVESERVAEESQVTLLGNDEQESLGALPNAWSDGRRRRTAGPLEIEWTESGRGWDVTLSGPDNAEQIASNLPSEDVTEEFVDEFVRRVDPDDVSFRRDDATVAEASSEAKAEALPDAATLGGMA